MSHTINLENYFARIGYQGPRAATLDVLRAIHRLHPAAIPFENLNPLTRRPVRLELEAVERKLVTEKRGGYCFEQNILFANVLMQLGFRVTPMLARVVWGREPGTIAPRTHMVLRVDIDGDAWIADVGFGAVTLTAPLRQTAGLAQPIPLGTFRLADAGRDTVYLEVLTPDESWTRVYHVDLRAVEWIDYETSNWYTSTSPDSKFVHNLLACRVLPERRLALFNDQFNERDARGQIVNERRLASAAELADCLRERFGLNLEDIDIADVFERVRTRDEDA
ncbi:MULTISPECIES: arylamine N-acetyltransferase [unclassified Paraburkholderia]|uniref:arylamine N-acetyltransferase family protein n=1 Tax=unclassified Paraburkholderia TaxID=2615204 RepID=UPI00160A47F6|nr:MULTISPECIES: arylamine N-acetyltransferase [unclassified Paraburkholderia]MBB5445745.1 N-hydroxyarylamine O-acetyltransferase [Paraburkholderia sp. WSM4177]MBB5486203.1 N-hydroxyarylamine O-acetyltransferase [Paraburkholderia sp. WSM4180]